MTTTKTPPVFTVRADEVTIGDYIITESTTPVARPIITLVTSTQHIGDDVNITTRNGVFTTSEGNLLTCLGKTLEIR